MPFPPLLEEHMKKTRILSIALLLTLLLHWEIGTEEKRQRERIQPELIHAGEEKK